MPPRLAKPVTLRELSQLMGWSTSRAAILRLRKRLLDRQRLTPHVFIQKTGPGPNSPWVTTVPLIRQHCPEMVDRPAEVNDALNMVADVVTMLRKEVAELKAENRTLKACLKAMDAKLKSLEAA